MKTFKHFVDRSRASARELAPYAATALLVPGGTLIAGALWWFRRRKSQKVLP